MKYNALLTKQLSLSVLCMEEWILMNNLKILISSIR